MAAAFRTTVKRLRNQGLSKVKKALDNKENPLSIWEIEFIRTSCHILDINSEEVMNRIVKKALEKGAGQAKRVMDSIRSQLDDLGKKAENYKRPTPTPALAMRTYDDMDAPSRSLAHLQGCVRGLRDSTVGGYSKGIKVAKIAVENAIGDFKGTVARTMEACRWKHGMAQEWYAKGEEVCGDLSKEAEEALKEAEARVAAEAKVRIMEDQCEELVNLAEQAEKQAISETEPAQLIELEEEMEQRKDTMEGLGRSLKETVPTEFKERAQQAVQDSMKIVEEGKRHLGHVRARLEFFSADSESGSYKGPTGAGAAANPGANPWGGLGRGAEQRRTA
jgi:predicted HicB family RNase H-like nuclease